MRVMATVPAAQYLRVSNDHQRYSLAHQATIIGEYAERKGFSIVETYSDSGRSGLRLTNRPALIRLLRDVLTSSALFRAVLIYDVSRWGRFQDCDEAAHYEFLCKSAGVEVHYCAECFENNNSISASVMKALKRTMAAEYSRELGEKTFLGCKKIAAVGFKQGGKPGFGLRRMMVSADGKQTKILSTGEVKGVRTDRVILVPGLEWEVECVREMYRLVLEENRTPYYITRELNRKGIPSTSGKWRLSAVLQILTHPKYCGTNVWNRSSSRLGTRRRPTLEANWIVTPGAFQSIVSPEQFRKRAAETCAAEGALFGGGSVGGPARGAKQTWRIDLQHRQSFEDSFSRYHNAPFWECSNSFPNRWFSQCCCEIYLIWKKSLQLQSSPGNGCCITPIELDGNLV